MIQHPRQLPRTYLKFQAVHLSPFRILSHTFGQMLATFDFLKYVPVEACGSISLEYLR
jgi:hypothetical protein